MARTKARSVLSLSYSGKRSSPVSQPSRRPRVASSRTCHFAISLRRSIGSCRRCRITNK